MIKVRIGAAYDNPVVEVAAFDFDSLAPHVVASYEGMGLPPSEQELYDSRTLADCTPWADPGRALV